MLLKHAFGSSTTSIKIHTRTDGQLSNLGSLKSKQHLKIFIVCDLFFANDAALAAHSPQELLSQFSVACSNFSLTISLKKIKVLNQGRDILPLIKIKGNDI